MGGCCSCLFGASQSLASETELAKQQQPPSVQRSLAISVKMSARTIQVGEDGKVSGHGLALAGVSVEQDAAYWEWHLEMPNDGSLGEVKFGVSTRKDSKFYAALEAKENNEEDGTALMKVIPDIKGGDVVGVAVQQADLPMIQFLLNGEPLHDLAINRFRGTVYPSIHLPDGVTAKVIFNEDDFTEMSPHARFGPLMVSRGII